MPRPGVDPIDHYLAVLADKTGSLIATAAEFGAHYAGAGPDVVKSLRAFGEQIGIAFQLSDDILDIASESAESGKTPGTDLREGVATLPALYALRGTDGADARLRELVARPIADDAEHAEALRLLRTSTAMDEARATLRTFADQARETLATLPDVPAAGRLRGADPDRGRPHRLSPPIFLRMESYRAGCAGRSTRQPPEGPGDSRSATLMR